MKSLNTLELCAKIRVFSLDLLLIKSYFHFLTSASLLYVIYEVDAKLCAIRITYVVVLTVIAFLIFT